ncbi:MAG TPA: hypothetical protein VGJ47_01430 [Gemmatimonadaceae bacterium]
MLCDTRGAPKVRFSARLAVFVTLASANICMPAMARAQRRHPTPLAQQPYLVDRGPGIATSMFGEYVEAGELVVYPFYEYTLANQFEYKPAELGFGLDQDFRGKFREHEANSFIAYGLTDRILIEFESAYFTRATLRKSPSDPSSLPAVLKESGFGDTQAEIRYRIAHETRKRPDLFSYLEVDFPFQRHRRIIGTHDWEYKFGAGAIKGFGFGTLTLRAAGEYDAADKKVAFGEYALEYLKRFSPKFRFYTGIEGDQDEVEWIIEGQYWLNPHVHLKLNTAFGVTSKAPDVAPEVGVFFSFKPRMLYPLPR